ncbi:hypothetical protein HBI73_147180 [Parastagonospora nodorum]|nr:hypothetical protein HBI73_147180 [Parastagonospora nodorum]KAH5118939.1 hypothetical protein HBH71_085460 [Parastagonospora nodorum]KAH5187011.1 hypothetical protein HBH76_115540 [Parastagonospora nodorum]KAH5298967.1 hypothetical protein HBI12_199340 [Parastagonospora nodorum]KAH6442508.1 hypothetical protein HBI59_110270 [Parastagonospora nodorum]
MPHTSDAASPIHRKTPPPPLQFPTPPLQALASDTYQFLRSLHVYPPTSITTMPHAIPPSIAPRVDMVPYTSAAPRAPSPATEKKARGSAAPELELERGDGVSQGGDVAGEDDDAIGVAVCSAGGGLWECEGVLEDFE